MDLQSTQRSILLPVAVVIILIASIASTGVITSESVVAADTMTLMAIDGGDPDPISGGEEFVLDAANSSSVVAETRAGHGYIRIVFTPAETGGRAGDYPWTIELEAPDGAALATGQYYDAAPPAVRRPDQPGIFVRGNDFTIGDGGCSDIRGAFTIHEVAFVGLEVSAFSASWRQNCYPDLGPFDGLVRYNAAGDFPLARAEPPSLDFGQVESGTRTDTRHVTITSIGTEAVKLTHAFFHGTDEDDFRIETSSCEYASLAPGESCTIGVSALPHTNRLHHAYLQIGDNTYWGARVTPLLVEGVGDVQATASVTPEIFYPVPDGYFDELFIRGTRDEVVSVRVDIGDVSTGGSVFRSLYHPAGSGDFEIVWDGTRFDDYPAYGGDYDITVVLTDAGGSTKKVKERITLSQDWVEWKTKSVTRDGKRIALWGWSKDAKISFAGSQWADGVRLISNRGFATVGYQFAVPTADMYGWMTFKVLGKSPNGHKAVVALHDPRLGGYRDLANYDVAKKIGPRYTWAGLGTSGEGRRSNGKAHAAIMVWKGLGGTGKSVFDIRRVRFTVKYGIYHVFGVSTAGAAPDVRTSTGAVGTRVTQLRDRSLLVPLRDVPLPQVPPGLVDGPSQGETALDAERPTDPAPEPGEPNGSDEPNQPNQPTKPDEPNQPNQPNKPEEPTPENARPIADAGGPYVVDEGTRLRLDGSASRDSDGSVVAYEWSPERFFDDPTKKRPGFIAPDDGSVEIELRVTDDQGASDSASTTVTVRNVDPVVKTDHHLTLHAGETVDLRVNIRDAGDDEHDIVVDWGDGSAGDGTTHAYAEPGRYLVTVTVLDDDGGMGLSTLDVDVKQGSPGA